MGLTRGDLSGEPRRAQGHAVVIVGVPVAQPLQVQGHAQVGHVQEAAVIVPAKKIKKEFACTRLEREVF